jgi:soluble lytic murein transglycosylase
MRRAYPQFLTVTGDDLPRELQQVIFPVAYWDLIRKYASANNLDPYLMAALVAQESTFVPDVKSYANAYGLMQLLPSTARLNAQKLKLRYSTRVLTDPELNVRLGMLNFADTLKLFGEPYLALASYNAGDRAVKRWIQERPGLEREEFIDDIPYPETQNYVKRILGTADDYRRLYSPKS